jgi:putative tryptophan/tyrosine transport system substrate-binding protein
MRRRDFIRLISGSAMLRPFAVRAQQQSVPVIGYLSARSAEADGPMLAAFRQGLADTGYVEGRDVRIEIRFADGQYNRLPALMENLVAQKVAAVMTAGGVVPAAAAKAATATIPIVFGIADDPVRYGLVESMNRPGRNLTGVTSFQTVVMEKQIGLLSELLRGPSMIALLVDSQMVELSDTQIAKVQKAAAANGHQTIVVRTDNDSTLDATFAEIVRSKAAALLVCASPFFLTQSKHIVELAARHALPAMYWRREPVDGGGLVSYGSNTFEVYHQAGVYVGRILKGEKPETLPVVQPTKFELVLNLKTAKALGLEIPHTFLARADEVIE